MSHTRMRGHSPNIWISLVDGHALTKAATPIRTPPGSLLHRQHCRLCSLLPVLPADVRSGTARQSNASGLNRVRRQSSRCDVRCGATFDNQAPQRVKQQYIKPPRPPKRQTTRVSETVQSVRLAKALATAGVASRRASEELILQGAVKVNGQVVKEVVTMVDPAKDRVEYKGKVVDIKPSPRYYFAVNKPEGYICSAVDPEKGKSVVDLLTPWLDKWKQNNQNKAQLPPRFFSVGRLDVASQGLLLLTNDGKWAQDVAHPRNNITKEYHVRVNRQPSRRQLEDIAKGAIVDGTWVTPVEVALLRSSENYGGNGALIMVVVSEGRNREGDLETACKLRVPQFDSSLLLVRDVWAAEGWLEDMWVWNARTWPRFLAEQQQQQQDVLRQPAVQQYKDGRRRRIARKRVRLFAAGRGVPMRQAAPAGAVKNAAPVIGQQLPAQLRQDTSTGLHVHAVEDILQSHTSNELSTDSVAPPEAADRHSQLLDPQFFRPDGSLKSAEEIAHIREKVARDMQTTAAQQAQERWQALQEAKTGDFCSCDDPDFQVRVIVGSAGLEVVELTRTRIGGLVMTDLKPGAYRQLRRDELKAITDPEEQLTAMRRKMIG